MVTVALLRNSGSEASSPFLRTELLYGHCDRYDNHGPVVAGKDVEATRNAIE